MKSKIFRNDPLFLRNEYVSEGRWDFPVVKKQDINLENVELISYSDISSADTKNLYKGVHFFIDDWRFETLYNKPDRSIETLSKFRFVLTPDYSLYAEMPLWRQIESVGKARWVGANWQKHGLDVIPTISWARTPSFDFCFSSIEKNCIVAIGMIGCKSNHRAFMQGYNEMLNRIEPEAVICFGTPFPDMEGNIITVDYLSSRRGVH
ncbi:MAG: DUF4417 domain-containing protein [Lachnospiraceae bacterium]|nr:DUF4417 domain-containing protein [Lachnospiraceae bacterium]